MLETSTNAARTKSKGKDERGPKMGHYKLREGAFLL